jgi:hypothetical protein
MMRPLSWVTSDAVTSSSRFNLKWELSTSAVQFWKLGHG